MRLSFFLFGPGSPPIALTDLEFRFLHISDELQANLTAAGLSSEVQETLQLLWRLGREALRGPYRVSDARITHWHRDGVPLTCSQDDLRRWRSKSLRTIQQHLSVLREVGAISAGARLCVLPPYSFSQVLARKPEVRAALASHPRTPLSAREYVGRRATFSEEADFREWLEMSKQGTRRALSDN